MEATKAQSVKPQVLETVPDLAEDLQQELALGFWGFLGFWRMFANDHRPKGMLFGWFYVTKNLQKTWHLWVSWYGYVGIFCHISWCFLRMHSFLLWNHQHSGFYSARFSVCSVRQIQIEPGFSAVLASHKKTTTYLKNTRPSEDHQKTIRKPPENHQPPNNRVNHYKTSRKPSKKHVNHYKTTKTSKKRHSEDPFKKNNKTPQK